MSQTIFAVIAALVSGGAMTGLGVALWSSFRNRNYHGDNAWKQRDEFRTRGDVLHEILHKHQMMCREEHGMKYEDMDRSWIRPKQKEKDDGEDPS